MIRSECHFRLMEFVAPFHRNSAMSTLTLEPLAVPLWRDESGSIRVGRTRILLELVVREFRRGSTPEAITQTYDALDYNMDCAIVLGAEGKGVHDLVRKKCDFLVSIPMLGKVSSLNVSVAAGVVLYEVVRQRRKKAAPDSE